MRVASDSLNESMEVIQKIMYMFHGCYVGSKFEPENVLMSMTCYGVRVFIEVPYDGSPCYLYTPMQGFEIDSLSYGHIHRAVMYKTELRDNFELFRVLFKYFKRRFDTYRPVRFVDDLD